MMRDALTVARALPGVRVRTAELPVGFQIWSTTAKLTEVSNGTGHFTIVAIAEHCFGARRDAPCLGYVTSSLLRNRRCTYAGLSGFPEWSSRHREEHSHDADRRDAVQQTKE